MSRHHQTTNRKRGSSKCSAEWLTLAIPTLRGYSSSMATVHDRDPRWESPELKGCTGHAHRRINLPLFCILFNVFHVVFVCVHGTIIYSKVPFSCWPTPPGSELRACCKARPFWILDFRQLKLNACEQRNVWSWIEWSFSSAIAYSCQFYSILILIYKWIK